MREDIMAVQKEIEELKKMSVAMEMLKDSKKANRRICYSFTIVITLLIIGYFVTVGLFLKYISEIGSEDIITTTKTQELRDIGSIDNTNIVNGDMNGNDKAD